MFQYPAYADLHWSTGKKIAFRFCFIYIALYISQTPIIAEGTFSGYVEDAYMWLMDGMVHFFNEHIYTVKDELVPMGGSGDTSYGWAQLCMFLFIAAVGCVIWSILDRKRKNYNKLDYWICLATRYFIMCIAFLYGIIKLFAMQMIFPSLTQLATPLGDYLPMRLSWLFIGYSDPYQIFSGVMECMVGLLLLWRRTATLGTMLGFAVFVNVMVLNLAYDIPVKIFSINLVLLCLFLLVHEWQRIKAFFLLNKEAAACNLYNLQFKTKAAKIGRVVLKLFFIWVAVGFTLKQTYGWYQESKEPQPETILRSGVYDIEYLPGSDSIPRDRKWRDMIIERGGSLNIRQNDRDTTLITRYARSWMRFEVDSANNILELKKKRTDSLPAFKLRFELPDSNSIILRGRIYSDTVNMLLIRSKHKYQLAEKQFHWLSEDNR